jgi:hypothetical protein
LMTIGGGTGGGKAAGEGLNQAEVACHFVMIWRMASCMPFF